MDGKMKIMVHRTIAVLLIAFASSCEDRKGVYLTPNQVCFPNSGTIEVEMYDFGEDFNYRLGTYKSGYCDNAASASVRVKTSVELAEYNEIRELDILPSNSYVVSSSVFEFAEKERNKYIDITFHPDIINDLSVSGRQLVLPILVESSDVDVNGEMSVVLLTPKVITPVVYFEQAGLSNILVENSSPSVVEASFEMLANYDSRWDIHATAEVDPEALASYNQESGTNWNILPEAFYTFNGTVALSKGSNSNGILNVSVNRTSVVAGVYILPVTIESVSKFSVDSQGRRI